MRLLVWGAGAVGGTIGAYLARAGHDITLVDSAEDHVDAINTNGLSITGPIDTFTVAVSAFTPETITGSFSVVLLCVKAHHTTEAMSQLLPYLAPDGYVVSVQNGLNERAIAQYIGQERTIGSFINFGADYLQPGVVHRGNRAAVVLGELDGSITPRLRALHQVFLDFDDGTIITSNIWGYLWGKLAYGAQLFATALTNHSIADALASPAHQQLYIALAREVLAVAQLQGVTPEGFNGFNPLAFMPDADPVVAQNSLKEMVVFNRRSAKTHSGIWRDLAIRKRRTEIDAQIGAVVILAQEVGVPTPLLARLVDLIHEIEDGARPQGQAALDDLNRLVK